LFTWVAEHDRLDWEKPKRFERVFKVKWSQMKTPEERQREQNEVVSGDVQTYSSEDLSKLFHAASPRERLYILLGLNCGFTSSEIGSLARFELFLDDPQPFVHRKRPKTGVEARWKLWPETVAAIRQNLAERNPQQLAFLSIAGNPLVEVNDRCRRDVIKQAWAPLLKKAGIANPLGFKFLRKTGADRIKKLGGLEVSEMYLSHAEANGMNRHYANRNWTQMHGCLELLREQLKPLWHLKGDPESESAPTSSSSAESERREAA
jgi:integrase